MMTGKVLTATGQMKSSGANLSAGVLKNIRNIRLEVLCRKNILKKFAKCTEEHLCRSLFSNIC